jgi:uncharacterized caspase-like protein
MIACFRSGPVSDALSDKKRSVAVTLAILLALVIGGVVGFALGDRHGSAKLAPLTDFGAAMYTGMLTSSERRDGTDVTYENALRGYVSLLDNLTSRDPSQSIRQIYAADKALALIRLADLADKRGESAESTRLTSDALAACSTGGLPYCSSAELRQRARQVDALFERTSKSK